MSEVAPRPAPSRGRGTTRGRGGFRGHRTRQPNGDHKDAVKDETDQGELGEMKKKYSSQLSSLKELFPDWADVDLLFALEETSGDLERTIDHISEGNVSQFSDVKKKTKDRSRSKVKDAPAAETSTRPPRTRGTTETTRGRPRTERGGRGGRPPRGANSNVDTRNQDSNTDDLTTPLPVEPWDASTPTEKPTVASEPKKVVAAAPPMKTWASVIAGSKPTPKPKPTEQPASAPAPTPAAEPIVPSSDISSGYVEVSLSDAGESATPAEVEDVATVNHSAAGTTGDDTTLDLPPSKDQLTEDNVEHLPDSSGPAPIGTAASTVESSRGPDSTTASVVTPAVPRPIIGGYAASALKATSGGQARSASFQRRILEQQEAVVMPSKHAVDRAAVQFGSLGLNGTESPDVDDNREEAETRPQPPQHSPNAQPRASLPPAPRQEAVPETKPAPGLPPVAQKDAFAQQSGAIGTQPGQFGRFGQNHGETTSQKYDPFAQPSTQQSAFDSFTTTAQAQAQPQQATSQLGSSNDYSAYYNDRNQYNQYYGFGQQAAAGQDTSRAGFGGASSESFSNQTSQAQQQQNRFSENQSGHNTPNPQVHQGIQNQHVHHQQQPHGQGQHGGFPYQSHPYFNQPYYQAYMNQYAGYGQQNFGGGPYGGKGGMYGQPHHGFGVPQSSSYEQHSTSSPAAASGFSGDNSGLRGGTLGDYGRSGSAQPASGALGQNQQGQQSSSGFGNVPDVFGRSPGNTYQSTGQGQQYGGPQQGAASAQQQSSGDDSLKPFGDKSNAGIPTGPSSQPGRPTSATNSAQGAGSQAGQHGQHPQHHHQHHQFGGYPAGASQLGGQGTQYGGLGGGLGHQVGGAGQSHQGGGYGGYGSGFGGGSYGSYGRGAGSWSGNYSNH